MASSDPPETLVLTSRPAAGVALVRLNRPERRNALNMAVRREVAAALDALSADADVRCIVLTGDERAFAAGADLNELADLGPLDDTTPLRTIGQALERCRKPVIAAVRGMALGGGCEMALACDVVVAGEGAVFGQPEIRVGLMPGAGGVQRLVRMAGRQRALRWLLTGESMSAVEAQALGIVSDLVPDENVLPRALEIAGTIAAMPPRAVEAIKAAAGMAAEAPLSAAMAFDRAQFQMLLATPDKVEGIAAFFEKRRPVFTGR